jgi:tyrosyl-tRNA synthetase
VTRELTISQLLKQAGLTATTSEAVRLLKQGGVKIDGERVSDFNAKIKPGVEHVYQIGKRKFAKIKLI